MLQWLEEDQITIAFVAFTAHLIEVVRKLGFVATTEEFAITTESVNDNAVIKREINQDLIIPKRQQLIVLIMITKVLFTVIALSLFLLNYV